LKPQGRRQDSKGSLEFGVVHLIRVRVRGKKEGRGRIRGKAERRGRRGKKGRG
jgi:hypothetical protein